MLHRVAAAVSSRFVEANKVELETRAGALLDG
jgi:hypothetical protein